MASNEPQINDCGSGFIAIYTMFFKVPWLSHVKHDVDCLGDSLLDIEI